MSEAGKPGNVQERSQLVTPHGDEPIDTQAQPQRTILAAESPFAVLAFRSLTRLSAASRWVQEWLEQVGGFVLTGSVAGTIGQGRTFV